MTCTGCHYWRGLGDYNRRIKAFHYALDNFPLTRAHDGHVEKAEDCTHKITKEEHEDTGRIDEAKARALCKAGATLAEMAAALKQNAASEAGTSDAAR